jgi:hypothetical protein
MRVNNLKQLRMAGSNSQKFRGLNKRSRTKLELVLNRHGWWVDFSKPQGCFYKKVTADRKEEACPAVDRV